MDIKVEKSVNVKNVKMIRSRQPAVLLELRITGSLLIGIYKDHIQVWSMTCQIKLLRIQQLKGCNFSKIVCSKKSNWFVSVHSDNSLQSWKNENNGDWIGSRRKKKHSYNVYSLLLYSNEDYLISNSRDAIIVWKVDVQGNQLNHHYNFALKDDQGLKFAINQNQLIAWSTQYIILWHKGQNGKWEQLSQIENQNQIQTLYFFSDNLIAYKSSLQNVTNIVKISSQTLQKLPEEQLDLKGGPGYYYCSVPTIFNQKKEIFIQNHGDFIYFLKRQDNGRLKKISNDINVGSYRIMTINQNGQVLGIYNVADRIFTIYEIQYF